MSKYGPKTNVINREFIDYIVKTYIPALQLDRKLYQSINMSIFREALMHHSIQDRAMKSSSTTKPQPEVKSYERLEYLGDAVFHLVITEYLYHRYDEAEGFLTRLRIRIERGDSMAHLTTVLGLDRYIQMYQVRINEHILEDVFEAFLGAFYLNFGIQHTRTFVTKLIEKHKNLADMICYDDNYKDLLLQYYHQMGWGFPVYQEMSNQQIKILKASGRQIAFKKFNSYVRDKNKKIIGIGYANSKRKAEQLASKHALEHLKVIVDGELDDNWQDKIDRLERESKKKVKIERKTLSVFNINNRLLKTTNIHQILTSYNLNYKGLIKSNPLDLRLFREALTHKSYVKRKKSLTSKERQNEKESEKLALEELGARKSRNIVKLQKKSNERMQFLGVSVIHFIIGEYLYHHYPYNDEGFLTKLRCRLENVESLFYLACQTDIVDFVLISQNIEIIQGRDNVNIIGGGFGAFLGALYLQFGLGVSRQFLTEIMRIELDIYKIAESETNYKDLISQIYTQNHWGHPEYKTLKEEGPDHSKIFTRGIYLHGKLISKGRAKSKKKAEQIASRKMYAMYTEKLLKDAEMKAQN